jgi:Xaa-Pro aminopeptidase
MNLDTALNRVSEVTEAVDLGDHQPTYPDFPLDEYRTRYARFVALMDQFGVDALVLTQEEPVKYLSGYNSVIWAVGKWLPGALLATRDPKDAVLIPSAFDVGAAAGSSWVANVDGHSGAEDLVDKIDSHLDRLGLDRGRVAIERSEGSIVMLPLESALSLHGLVPASTPDAALMVSILRMLKSPAELDRLRRVVRATTVGYQVALDNARIGMTEKDIVAMVASKLYEKGGTAGTRPLFLNAVAGPDRYPLVDSPASDRELRNGDILFLDGGAGGDGYMSDIIRIAAFGDITPEAETFAAAALDANKAMVDSAAPGITVQDLYQAGQDVYVAEGLGEFGGALSGHGIGMELWERPFIKLHDDPDDNVRLRPGMVICIEPILAPVVDGQLAGIFVFEQQVAITEAGNEVLSGDLEVKLWRAS